jgi:hypothetical protein
LLKVALNTITHIKMMSVQSWSGVSVFHLQWLIWAWHSCQIVYVNWSCDLEHNSYLHCFNVFYCLVF